MGEKSHPPRRRNHGEWRKSNRSYKTSGEGCMLPGSPCHRTVKLADLCCTRSTSLSFCRAFGCLICLTWQMEVCDKTKAKGSPLSRHVSNEEKSHAPLTGSNQSPVPEHGNKKWDPFFRNRRRRAFNRFCRN